MKALLIAHLVFTMRMELLLSSINKEGKTLAVSRIETYESWN